MSVEAVKIDENGVTIKSFREIREALANDYKSSFGNLTLTPGTPDGTLVDLIAYAIMELAQGVQSAAANINVDTAEGAMLDYLATIEGLTRQTDETDSDLRDRIKNISGTGLATYDCMLTYLRDKISNQVSLIVNEEDQPDKNTIPAHSFAVYVPTDTENDAVAQAIWECKPAGIKAYGAETGNATDIAGNKREISFFRISSNTNVYMRITITKYNEETLPDEYDKDIKEAIVEWSENEYTPGKDVIPQRVVQAVFKVPGIATVNVEVSEDGATWKSTSIPIEASQYAVIQEDHIEVVVGN